MKYTHCVDDKDVTLPAFLNCEIIKEDIMDIVMSKHFNLVAYCIGEVNINTCQTCFFS